MDVRAYNREAWDRQVAAGNPWTIPVSSEAVAAARRGSLRFRPPPPSLCRGRGFRRWPAPTCSAWPRAGGSRGPSWPRRARG